MDLHQFQLNMYKRELRKLKTLEADFFMTELINDVHHEDFGINRTEAWEIYTAERNRRDDPFCWKFINNPFPPTSSGTAALPETESCLIAA